jgi:ATP-binding cassette subfamily B protein
LLAQLVLLAGQVSVEFMRSWILLHITTRLNLSILEDFLAKLMRLPIAFFDSRNIGDIMQRIGDQQRIQTFLTGPALNTLFSAFSFLIFSAIIAFYNVAVFMVFMAGSLLYIAWVLLFLGYRRRLDYKRFDMMSKNSSSLVQLINGMQEIKLNNCETKKIWDWKKIQTGLFKINMMSLTSSQYQQGGGYLIHQVKNFCITFFSATAVIKGRLTLGEMLAIQYIVGQLNGPVEQLIAMVQSVQDARISMDRMNEIHIMRDEESGSGSEPFADQISLYLNDVTYYYPGAGRQPVLENIDAVIPVGKTTAIVGMSGSGKTTLLKLLLKFYAPAQGRIQLGNEDLQDVSSRGWRARCGVVLQDSYIFSDSIARNIAPADEEYDIDRIWQAVEIANIREFVESLPAGLDTKIGMEGDGISQGQRQRILIARAVYKDPAFIFLDEATNALDTNNEKIIQQNLDHFFKGRTVIVAAHRLSTVKKADQILVMHKGRIVERGRHEELMAREGMYHQLVKDQF